MILHPPGDRHTLADMRAMVTTKRGRQRLQMMLDNYMARRPLMTAAARAPFDIAAVRARFALAEAKIPTSPPNGGGHYNGVRAA